MERISITDFTPGIHGDYHGGILATSDGAVLRNGAATIDNTWRCCADLTGALVPLPARGDPFTEAIDSGATPAVYPAGRVETYLVDAMVAAPFGVASATPAANPTFGVFTLTSTFYNPAGGGVGTYRQYWRGRYNKVWTAAAQDFLWARSLTATTVADGISPGSLIMARNVSAGSDVLTDMHVAAAVSTNIGQFDSGAFGTGDAANTTADAMTSGANYSPTFSQSALAYPQVGSPSTNNFTTVLGNASAKQIRYLVGHQGRMVCVRDIATAFGVSTQFAKSDHLSYTPANDMDATAVDGTYGEENPNRTAFLASLTADELLIMRDSGGAVMVRGDLDNPTVQRLPYLESPYGVTYRPVATPRGLVYTSRNGVFLWAGGDTSEKLSRQLDGAFFVHTTDVSYLGARGRMEWWHPWVCLPNNYLLDTRTDGWWRLEDPSTNTSTPYNCYAVDPATGTLYAFPWRRSLTQETVYDQYAPATLASSYSWQSQPLAETRDKVRSFRKITVMASPGANTDEHTITVTLTGFDKDGVPLLPVSTVFTFIGDGSGAPVVLYKTPSPNFTAMYAQVRIEVSTTNGAAAKIHGVHIDTEDNNESPES